MIWGWSTDGQVIRDGVGAIRPEESDARERVVREVACSARLRPDADRIDIGEGGGPAKVTDKEAIRDLALMVKAHDGPHGGEVDLFLAVRVDAVQHTFPISDSAGTARCSSQCSKGKPTAAISA